MPDILLATTISVPPDKLYKALTEQEGIRSWWTEQATAAPKVGTTSEFGFYNGRVIMHMEVAQLEAGKKVMWKPIDGIPDWSGTRITWDLTPVEGGTKLLFGHRDFASSLESLPTTSFNWAMYIMSLKKYAETGTGSPHTDAANP